MILSDESQTPDIFLTSFNTPKGVANISLGNREAVKNMGFNLVWPWQDAVYWESTLADGAVPAYTTIDAQLNLRIPKLESTVKVGGTNIFYKRYYQFAAGPAISALYYVTVTVNGLLYK